MQLYGLNNECRAAYFKAHLYMDYTANLSIGKTN